MIRKTLVEVTLFTGLLGAAGPSDSGVFTVRSFHDPETKKKISGPFFSERDPKDELKWVTAGATVEFPKNDGKCAIPLLEFKAKKTGDAMATAVPPALDSASVMPPPLHACKGWNK